VDNGFVAFEHVRIPRVNLLNRFGDVLADGSYQSSFSSEGKRFGALLGELITGRTSLCVNTMNTRRIAATVATRYAHQRLQFGPDETKEIPIIDYPSHCVRLMPIIASCYAHEFALQEMMRRYARLYIATNNKQFVGMVHALVAGMKATLTWDTQIHLQTMRLLCGGNGYSAFNQIVLLSQDNDIMQTYEGDNTVLVQQLGGYLLKEFSKQFSGNVLSDTILFVRKQMGIIVKRRNPIITRITLKSHLRSTNFHLKAFEYRTATLLTNCAQEYSAQRKKQGAFDAWSSAVPTMVKLARAYIEQFTLEQFAKALDDIPDKKSKLFIALKLCCDVYALNIMDKHGGEFADLFRGNKSQAISKQFEQCCMEMKEYSLSLVDAFEIPGMCDDLCVTIVTNHYISKDFLLDAPIGLSRGHYIDNILHYTRERTPNNAEPFQLLSKL
jgi:acyl-CoA oxidase